MIRIGTRGSLLALRQAHEVARRLSAAHDLNEKDLEIVEIRTSGDRIQDRPLSEVGGKGLFTKEIEDALFDGRIDVAVHSLKDVETVIPEETELAAVLPREDVREVFISRKYKSVDEMPEGARLGTSSLRRRAQACATNPGIDLVDFRGNVQTRLQKLADGVADATFLARAGLNRLGINEPFFHDVAVENMLPAIAQGAVALQIRRSDTASRNAVSVLDDATTACCVEAERAYLARLDGSCRTPIAGYAEIYGNDFRFRGEVLGANGARRLRVERRGDVQGACALAVEAADELLAAGAGELLSDDA